MAVMDPHILDKLAARLRRALPPGMRELQQDAERNFSAVLQSTYAKLNLVAREEYDVLAALLNAEFDFPARRITIYLAPADLPKEGGRFDLPIALGILAASGQIPPERFNEFEFIGDLALAGALRRSRGALPAALHSRYAGRALS